MPVRSKRGAAADERGGETDHHRQLRDTAAREPGHRHQPVLPPHPHQQTEHHQPHQPAHRAGQRLQYGPAVRKNGRERQQQHAERDERHHEGRQRRPRHCGATRLIEPVDQDQADAAQQEKADERFPRRKERDPHALSIDQGRVEHAPADIERGAGDQAGQDRPAARSTGACGSDFAESRAVTKSALSLPRRLRALPCTATASPTPVRNRRRNAARSTCSSPAAASSTAPARRGSRADVGVVGDRIAAIGQLGGARGEDADRRVGPRRRAGLHRHARASPNSTSSSTPRAASKITQGVTTEITGEGSVDRAAQRRAGRRRRSRLRPLQGHARLPDPRRLLRAARARAPGDQPRHLRRRRRPARLCDRQRRSSAATAGGARRDEDAGRAGDGAGRARRQHVARIRAGPVRLDRRDRRAREGRAAIRRHLHLAPAVGVGRRSSRRSTRCSRSPSSANIPAEVWHLKTAYKANWGRMPEVLRHFEAARARGLDVTANMYPYDRALERPRRLPAAVGPRRRPRGDACAPEGSGAARARSRSDMDDPNAKDWENQWYGSGGGAGVMMSSVLDPSLRKWEGKTSPRSARRWARTRATR